MITEIKMFMVVCDACGAKQQPHNSLPEAVAAAEKVGWTTKNMLPTDNRRREKDICPICIKAQELEKINPNSIIMYAVYQNGLLRAMKQTYKEAKDSFIGQDVAIKMAVVSIEEELP